ncbi:uncharacterized protein LOC101851806 [Aplysia californica]|uniref:Uncharacterized protein LOC101851806 n=1 Tax=Aplysia californica TaxID=6500 RepID=A0ABM0JQU8_APLCA|nr:uncharacterized protein LOC101851806 [Aplysia californica]
MLGALTAPHPAVAESDCRMTEGIEACLQELHSPCHSVTAHKEEPLHCLLTKSPLHIEKSPCGFPSLLQTWSGSPKSTAMNWPQADKRKHARSAPYSTSRPRRNSLKQNLFLEGFQDCASEVVRFLKEEEQIDDSNPLLHELESHLQRVSQVICQEKIEDVDSESDSLNSSACSGYSSSPGRASPACLHHASTSQLNSPTFSTFTRISELDASLSECEVTSSSQMTAQEMNQSHSPIAEPGLSQNLSVSDLVDNFGAHLASCTDNPDNNISPSLCGSSAVQGSCVLSLQQLALSVVSQQKHSETPLGKGKPDTVSESLFSLVQYGCSIHPSTTVSLPRHPQTLCGLNLSQLSDQRLSTDSTLPSGSTQMPQMSWALKSSSTTSPSTPTFMNNTIDTPSTSLQHISSILELKPNFLPGIGTSSLASGNFADILLSIESCQHHHDPKVRALADELVHLIHSTGSDDEEEDDDDVSDEDDDLQDEDQQDVDSDSGVENVEDNRSDVTVQSIDWGSPVDMIEQ